MDSTTIGLWVSGGMLVLVFMGMRVAYATAIAGLVGLFLINWARRDFSDETIFWALEVAVKPPVSPPCKGCQSSTQPYSNLHPDRLSGLSGGSDAGIVRGRETLDCLGSGGLQSPLFSLRRLRCCLWRVCGHSGGLCAYCYPRDAQGRI